MSFPEQGIMTLTQTQRITLAQVSHGQNTVTYSLTRILYDPYMTPLYGRLTIVQHPKVDPMVRRYGPLIRNPHKSIITPLYTTYKTGAHSFEPFKEAGGPY